MGDDGEPASPEPGTDGGGPVSQPVAAALSALLALAVAAPALTGSFVLDDQVAVTGSACVRGTLPISEIFARTFWCEDPSGTLDTASWRPLTMLVWRGLWSVAGGTPWIFHALSAALHAANAAMVVALGRRLGATRRSCLAAGLAFAAMPLHAEVAASVVGAAGSLAALLTLGASWLAAHDATRAPVRVAGAAILALAACLAREDGVLALPVVLACAVAAPGEASPSARRDRALTCLGVGLAVTGALVWRAAVLPELSATAVPAHVNPVVGLDPFARIKTAFGLAWRYHAVALAGGPLAADYAYDAIPVGADMHWWRAGLGAVAVGTGIGAAWGVRRQSPAASIGLAWWLMGLALATHLLVVTPALFAERVVYGASAGLCLALGVGLDALIAAAPHRRRVLAAVGVLWLVVMAWRFGAHAWRWRGPASLIEHTVAVVPQNARARAWAAELALRRGAPTAALEHARAAQSVRPRWGRAVAFEAAALDQLGQPEAALAGFRRAMTLDSADAQSADLFVQFLRRYGHHAQAELVTATHAAAVAGAPDVASTAPSRAQPRPPAR